MYFKRRSAELVTGHTLKETTQSGQRFVDTVYSVAVRVDQKFQSRPGAVYRLQVTLLLGQEYQMLESHAPIAQNGLKKNRTVVSTLELLVFG